MDLFVIILAAGNSTRLKSVRSKVMHPIAGRPMIDYVLATARSLKPKKIALVLGHDRETLQSYLVSQSDLLFVHQKERLGTGHAAYLGLEALLKAKGKKTRSRILILNGDVPFLKTETLRALLEQGHSTSLALLTASLSEPTGYGRIIRDASGKILSIVEEKNASAQEKSCREVNAGVYTAETQWLKKSLSKIKPNHVTGELYITDLVELSCQQNLQVASLTLEDSHEILGVNTREDLAFLNQLKREEILEWHLAQGVGMQDPQSIFIDAQVKIGSDTFLNAGVQLLGKTRVGKNCQIEPGCILKDAVLADGVTLKAYSYLEDCRVARDAVVGPFARIRPGSILEQGVKVGNFVELKKTKLGKGSKASHLSYLGDTIVGKNANIGAGTITCNYDGKKKFQTIIGDEVFIGSDTQLVAPVKLGRGAYVGAGTTVTKDVPAGQLAISRTLQQNRKWRSKNK